MDSTSTASSSPSSHNSFIQKYKLRRAKVKMNGKTLKDARDVTKAALRASKFKVKETSRDIWSKTRGPLEKGRRCSKELVDLSSDLLASLSIKVHNKIHHLSHSNQELNLQTQAQKLDFEDDELEDNFWGSDFSYSSDEECVSKTDSQLKVTKSSHDAEEESAESEDEQELGIDVTNGSKVYHIHERQVDDKSCRNSSSSCSSISASTPTLLKYRKLSQRPRDQPPPPPSPPPLPKSSPPKSPAGHQTCVNANGTSAIIPSLCPNIDLPQHDAQEKIVDGASPAVNEPQCVTWFRKDLTRTAAEQHLLSNKDLPEGSFLVRPGSCDAFPYSLSLVSGERVYHLNIRATRHGSETLYSLGKGSSVTGRNFPSLQELVDFYANKPLLLVSGRNRQQMNEHEMSQGSESKDQRKQVKLHVM